MRSNQKIKIARKKAKITQDKMAEKLRVCRSTYALYESGKIGLSVDKLMEIAEIVGAPAESLLPDEDWLGRKYEVQQ